MPVRAKASEEAQQMFRALGDETRLRLLRRLRGGEQCVTEAGLVTDRREGRWVYYALNPGGLETMRRLLGELKPSPRVLRVIRRCD